MPFLGGVIIISQLLFLFFKILLSFLYFSFFCLSFYDLDVRKWRLEGRYTHIYIFLTMAWIRPGKKIETKFWCKKKSNKNGEKILVHKSWFSSLIVFRIKINLYPETKKKKKKKYENQ